jgi:hypothetical protein
MRKEHFLYSMHPDECHTKDIYWDSLHNNSSEKDKTDTNVSTCVLLAVGCNATCTLRRTRILVLIPELCHRSI